eukprot:Plantae.Rhodophyta-Palmaria_palmata.ctg5596.p1 GENE.Plantae.Rhodophyta-Palmaria_palmata.ctg5596~~Plantae.Rhodophyta-Palmaria_palmata.ctg5596.p1  ORF type:complete len:353 (+),score=75.00 Plantae.Rhodophyta-Palmaria_palmata.ctg5596:3-1061(+)
MPTTLDPTTADLVQVMFSKDMRDSALAEFNLDLKRLPLGVPSKQQIEKGVQVLEKIQNKLSGAQNQGESFVELSNEFYTSIPHSFGRSRPPVINDSAALQSRFDMVDILMDMLETNETVQKIEAQVVPKAKKIVPNPIDQHYLSLSADLSLLAASPELSVIRTYFDSTKGQRSSAKLLNVWRVDRKGEGARFDAFRDIQNRKLLFHGTNIAVAAPIVTNGMRIMPHSGGRVGSGIYLASQMEKSAMYTSGYGSKFAVMFLAEAPCGKSHTVVADGHHASSLKKAPTGFESVHAVGSVTPNSWTPLKIDGNDVQVPAAPASSSGTKSSFEHDEFLLYEEAQVRLRYLLTVKLY